MPGPPRRHPRASSSRRSAPGRSAACCSPTWAPTCCSSTGPARAEPGPRSASAGYDVMMRGRRSVTLDLKSPDGVAAALELAARADALIEGFRPGVMERLGLGPDALLARNPKLVYGRMTGWGQDGPLARARRPRHQLHRARRRAARASAARARRRCRRSTWSATSAAAACCSRFGIACALLEARASGQGPGGRRGDGRRRVAARRRCSTGMLAAGRWTRRARRQRARHRRALVRRLRDAGRQVRLDRLDRGRSSTTSCSQRLGLDAATLPAQHDRKGWPALRDALRGSVQVEDARRVVRACSRARTPASRRCSRSPKRGRIRTTSRARKLRHRRRRRAAGAGAALLAHAGRDSRRAARARRGRARGARRLGIRCGRCRAVASSGPWI